MRAASKGGARCLLVLLAGTALARAQDVPPLRLAAALGGGDAGASEEARRRLCALPAAELPLDALRALLAGPDADAAAAAASVLAHHGIAAEDLRALLPRASALWFDVLPWASDAALVELARGEDAGVRRRALLALDERGALDDALLRAALDDADETVADAALDVLLYERTPFPAGIVTDLSQRARARLVEALGERPRAAAAPWLQRLLRGDTLDQAARMSAIAALPPEQIDAALGREVLEAATDPEASGLALRAAWRMPAAVVDRLVPFAHARLVAGAEVHTILACLENASALGERQVLLLAGAVGGDAAEAVCHWLTVREAPGLSEAIASALDGHAPLEPHLLRRAGPLIDSPERRLRVLRVLENGSDEERLFAFYALAEAGCYAPEMLAFAEHDAAPGGGTWSNRLQRLRALLDGPLQSMPAGVLLALLDDDDGEVQLEVCRSLVRSPYPLAIERALLDRVGRADPLALAAAQAIAAFGSREAVQAMLAAASPEAAAVAVDALVKARKPWVRGLLAGELARLDATGRADGNLGFRLVLGLAALAEGDAADRLVRGVPAMSLAELRAAGDVALAALRPDHVPLLREMLLGPNALPDDAREELADWLADRPDLDAAAILEALTAAAEPEEIRAVARRGLLRGPQAPPFHAALRAAMARPLGGDDRELAYEILGAARRPLRALELETIARLVLLAPLADPRAECADALEGAPRGADYPMHLPIVDLLRRDGAVRTDAFARVAAELPRQPNHWALSGRRLAHLLGEIARFPHLRERLGPILAALLLDSLDRDPPYRGLAELVLGEAAERQARFAQAAEHYRRAARGLRRTPLPAPLARTALDESGPEGRPHLHAALAARAAICEARARLAAGELAAARAALGRARDLAEADERTLAEIDSLLQELDK